MADNDNVKPKSKKSERRTELEKISQEMRNFKYLNTTVVEIENLLPIRVIKDFSKGLINEDHSGKLDSYHFEVKDYSNKRLGAFYKSIFEKLDIPEADQRAFSANSGTLTNEYKLKLCDYFLDFELSYEELIADNKVLEGIIKEAYEFINR